MKTEITSYVKISVHKHGTYMERNSFIASPRNRLLERLGNFLSRVTKLFYEHEGNWLENPAKTRRYWLMDRNVRQSLFKSASKNERAYTEIFSWLSNTKVLAESFHREWTDNKDLEELLEESTSWYEEASADMAALAEVWDRIPLFAKALKNYADSEEEFKRARETANQERLTELVKAVKALGYEVTLKTTTK